MTNPLAQDLGGVVRLLEKATPGEWHWVRRHDCYQIQAPHGGGTVVMDCVRHGMRGADFRFAVSLDGQPRGKRGGILMKATELGDATLGGFYHPDAAAMVECVNFLRTHSAEIAGALAAEVRCGEWVLVPRCITGPAADYLAGFDMDSIGNNRGDAAPECWAGLVDMLGREPPELKFSNPVFHAGTNLTVRRGTKWYREEWAVVMVEGVKVTVRLSCMTHKFSRLTDHWVRDEHDPSCRTVAGLLAEMQRVYPGFNEHEEVTLVRFDLPAAMQQGGGGGEAAA